MQAYEAQLERLKQALNVESDTAFSQELDVSQGSVSGAKKRGQIPHSWFFQVSEKTGYSIDWLFRGIGPMYPEDGKPEFSGGTDYKETTNETGFPCSRCIKIERRLEMTESERRQSTEKLLETLQANVALTAENGQLRLENMRIAQQLETARQMSREYASAAKNANAQDPLFDERQIIPSSDASHAR